MTLQEINKQILAVIDEVGADNNASNYPFDQLIKEATKEILLVAPAKCFQAPKSFTDATVHASSDGSGHVELPDDFLRLITFRMSAWQRPVTALLSTSDYSYTKQFNSYTRGGVAKPRCYRENFKLLYFSVTPKSVHTISEAVYIPMIEATHADFPAVLITPLVWLTASKCLLVTGEAQQSTYCNEVYTNHLNTLSL